MAFDWDVWNASSGAERVVLARVRYWDEDASAVDDLYIASEPYYDETNSIAYDNTMVEVPTLFIGTRELEGGAVDIGLGSLVISNIEGKYDYLFDNDENNFYGRWLRFLVGPRGHAIADFRQVFSGWTANATWESEKTINIQARTYLERLNIKAQRNRFASGGSIPSQLVGKTKPWGFGEIYQFAPTHIHTSNRDYLVNDEAVQDTVTAYNIDGGNFIGQVSSETHSSATFSLSSDGADGRYLVSSQGYAASGGGSMLRGLDDVIDRILTRDDDDSFSVLESSEVDATSLTDLGTDATMLVSYYLHTGEEKTVLEVFEDLMPYGYLWGFNRDGDFFSSTLKDPSGETSQYDIVQADILRNGVSILESSVPWWRLVIDYSRNWVPSDRFRSGVSQSNRSLFGRAFRATATQEDSTIKTAYKNSKIKRIELYATGNVDGADPQERGRLWDLFSVRRRIYEVRCWAKPLSWEIGDIVTLTYPRFGLDAGKKLVFIGSENQLNSGKVTAYLWG